MKQILTFTHLKELIINQSSEAKGTFWAKDVLIGSDVNVAYDSAWGLEF